MGRLRPRPRPRRRWSVRSPTGSPSPRCSATRSAPIPHTAIIPRRKDQIGRSLGEFVQGTSSPRRCSPSGSRRPRRPAPRALAARAGQRRAGQRGRRRRDAGHVEVLDDRDVQEAIGGLVERRLRATRSPAARQGHRRRRRGGHHQRLLDAVLTGLVVVPRRQPGDAAEPGSTRSRRGGSPSRSTTASSGRSSSACSASSPTSPPTPTTRCASPSTVASGSLPSGCATTR